MKTKKAQLIFHIWLKLVWRVCDLCLGVLPVEVASAAKIFKRICVFRVKFSFYCGCVCNQHL